MSRETQPTRLARGRKYRIGERVLEPVLETSRMVFSNIPEVTILISDVEKRARRYVVEETWDCSGDDDWREIPPELRSLKQVAEGTEFFKTYVQFIQQHGGQAA